MSDELAEESLHDSPWWWQYPSPRATVAVLVLLALGFVYMLAETGLLWIFLGGR